MEQSRLEALLVELGEKVQSSEDRCRLLQTQKRERPISYQACAEVAWGLQSKSVSASMHCCSSLPHQGLQHAAGFPMLDLRQDGIMSAARHEGVPAASVRLRLHTWDATSL